MELSQFTSLFEILAGFNFAYTLADTFTSSLNDKMLSSFKRVKDNLVNIDGKMKMAAKSLIELKAVEVKEKTTDQEIEQHKVSLRSYVAKLETLTERMKKNIELSGLTLSFKYVCFYSALFSVFVLIPIGFVSPLNDLNLNTCSIKLALVVASILTILFQIYWIRKDRILIRNYAERSHIGYRGTLIAFFCIFAAGLFTYIANYKLSTVQFENNYYDTVVIVLTLIAPSLHFIYYFYRAYRNAWIRAGDYQTEVQIFENDYDDWHTKNVNACIKFHKEFRDRFEQTKDNGTPDETKK